MSDLIDRQALLKTLNENKIEFDSDINYFIMHAPSEQPEIIRCKDCRYHGANECKHSHALIVSKDDDFCSYAERRADETD